MTKIMAYGFEQGIVPPQVSPKFKRFSSKFRPGLFFTTCNVEEKCKRIFRE